MSSLEEQEVRNGTADKNETFVLLNRVELLIERQNRDIEALREQNRILEERVNSYKNLEIQLRKENADLINDKETLQEIVAEIKERMAKFFPDLVE